MLLDAKDFRRQVSKNDQRKLDEYLDSVHEVEQRIEAAGQKGELQGWRPTLSAPNIPRPADGIPQDIAEHMRLMCDIMVLGFQTDTTRVSTYIGSTPNGVSYPELGFTNTHHSQTHHNEEAENRRRGVWTR